MDLYMLESSMGMWCGGGGGILLRRGWQARMRTASAMMLPTTLPAIPLITPELKVFEEDRRSQAAGVRATSYL
jgi:hypothetical protein